jgi:hypothetical protein
MSSRRLLKTEARFCVFRLWWIVASLKRRPGSVKTRRLPSLLGQIQAPFHSNALPLHSASSAQTVHQKRRFQAYPPRLKGRLQHQYRITRDVSSLSGGEVLTRRDLANQGEKQTGTLFLNVQKYNIAHSEQMARSA